MSEFINLTYAEAWEALAKEEEVFYKSQTCASNQNNLIVYKNPDIGVLFAPFHLTEKIFTIKKEQEYEILGLHDDWVEIEVFGLKAYQMKGDKCIYTLANDGRVFLSYGTLLGAVDFIGSVVAERIRVTVNADKTIKMEKI